MHQRLSDPVASVDATPPEHRTLAGRFVVLAPPEPAAEVAVFYPATHGDPAREATWTYLGYGPFASEAAMLAQLEKHAVSKDPLFFTVRDRASGAPLGMVSFMRMDTAMGVVELGHIWYLPDARRTRVNTEAIYLMLRECFQRGFRRVEWKCDALNRPSREAALRLGFSFEGIFRQHLVVKGYNRDTAWFSLLDREWPAMRENFEHWLYGDEAESLYSLNMRVGRYHPG